MIPPKNQIKADDNDNDDIDHQMEDAATCLWLVTNSKVCQHHHNCHSYLLSCHINSSKIPALKKLIVYPSTAQANHVIIVIKIIPIDI